MKIKFKPLFLIALILLFIIFQRSTAFSYCFVEAGEMYDIPSNILRAIAEVESSFDAYAVNHNKDGSYDYGLMQINSWWADKIGGDLWRSLGDPCMNVKVGAWILAQCFQRLGYTLQGVGCYHSPSAEKQLIYARKIYEILQ
jgi:hypothetical protein